LIAIWYFQYGLLSPRLEENLINGRKEIENGYHPYLAILSCKYLNGNP